MDMTGEAPSSLYLTKIEDHRLPSGGTAMDATTAAAAASGTTGGGLEAGGGTAYPTPGATSGGAVTIPVQTYNDESNQAMKRWCATVCVAITIAVVAVFAINGGSGSYTYSSNDDWSPSYPTMNDDWTSPSYPIWSPTNNDDDFYKSPIWSPTYTWTLRPDIFKPFPPTSSPAPSTTPYPTYEPFTFPPALTPIFDPSSDVTTNPSSDVTKNNNRLGDGNTRKKKKKVAPAIISPTFIRDPTRSPSRREISDGEEGLGKIDTKESQVQSVSRA
jgi:hypothetical protein